jgi:hypothetical protein
MSGIKHLSQIKMMVSPTEDSHVVTYGFLREYSIGKVKLPCVAVSAANLNAMYTGSPEFTLAGVPEILVVDGVTLALGDRVLVAGQVDKTQNGVYAVTQVGTEDTSWILMRTEDFNSGQEINSGVRVAVTGGSGAAVYYLATPDPIHMDATNLVFARDTASAAALEVGYDIIGNNLQTDFTVTHNFGTKDVTVTVYDAAGDTVFVETARPSVNQAAVKFGAPVADTESYRVLVATVLKG